MLIKQGASMEEIHPGIENGEATEIYAADAGIQFGGTLAGREAVEVSIIDTDSSGTFEPAYPGGKPNEIPAQPTRPY